MSTILAIGFGLGSIFGKLGASQKHGASTPAVPTGDGTMDFSNADDSALVALLEDI